MPLTKTFSTVTCESKHTKDLDVKGKTNNKNKKKITLETLQCF